MGDVLIENVLNALAAGLVIGCLYGLMCIGLGLIFGIMNLVNFAQGELLMLGMYVSLYLVGVWGALAFLGPAAPFVGALLTAPVLFAGGALLHRLLLARVSGLRTSGLLDAGAFGQLIVTLGLSLILQNAGLIVFGSSPRSVLTPLAARAFMIGPIIGDATLFLNKARLVACAAAIVVALALWLLMERTRWARRCALRPTTR